ncbi:MAG: FGGY family carbohydrate kinase [Ferruginibacter sp.]
MLLLGMDLGTSSVKVSVTDAATGKVLSSAQYPEEEMAVTARQPGWAEQSPEQWWHNVQQAVLKVHASHQYDPADIKAIGISYQMHGLVVVDKTQQVLRDSIIWCDSRAVEMGNKAFDTIGHEKSLSHLLNSPGNFTASKLAWVKQNEPELYSKIDKIMLPGDFIAMKLTGEISTSISSLSEGVFWDFKNESLSADVLNHYGIDTSLIPPVKDVFSNHGQIKKDTASALQLSDQVIVAYKAGDQPNNALSLNVLEPGEVAATAGTSGVVYGVTDTLAYDVKSRVNTFAHVNYTAQQKRLGVLLCINGTGILNRWIKNIAGNAYSYSQMNEMAAAIAPGSEGVSMLPFGNGAERLLENKFLKGHINNLDFNVHTPAHLFRAAQEGIAFAFRYGLDMMKENGMQPSVIRAGRANMFLSDVFASSFVNATQVPVELYNCDGSVGAAIGAGMGAGIYATAKDAFKNFSPIKTIAPAAAKLYDELYGSWKENLDKMLAEK